MISTTWVGSAAQAQTGLHDELVRIAARARGTVSVSCHLPGSALDCDLHPHEHAPMQSVFKYPLAVAVLHRAETGKLFTDQKPGEPLAATLDRTVRFLPEDRLPHSWSPLTERYPQANVDVPLRTLLHDAVAQSDNAAADLLLRIVGGPAVVQDYMHSIGITAFQLQDNEHGLARAPETMYRNWMEPAAAVQLLERLQRNPPLSPAANEFLLTTLTEASTGASRLRAGLPPGTPLAHKTGTSGEHDGLAGATNDIGLITLPDGRHLALAVFVSRARANAATRDKVIAAIARAVYEAALQAPQDTKKIAQSLQ